MTRRLARNTDPASSHAAARRHVESGTNQSQKAKVLAAILAYDGSTSAELAEAMGTDRYMPARRLADLEADGWVKKGPERDCRVNKTSAVTWLVVKGRR